MNRTGKTRREIPKLPWEKLLTAESSIELKQVGRLLSQARQRRGMSTSELAARIGVDRRTLSQLQQGSPKVSLGIFFQTLSALNLLKGIEEIVRPENDIEAINAAIRRVRSRKEPKKNIDEDEVNF